MGMTAKIRVHRVWPCLVALFATPVAAHPLAPALDYTIIRTPVYDARAEAEVPLSLAAPEDCGEIRAVLVQRASALAAVLDERTVGRCEPAAAGEVAFRFTVPNVRRLTRFAWEFNTCDTKQRCAAAGAIEFIALPQDYLQPVIDWSRAHTVFVADAAGWLVAFLDRVGIEYSENPRAVPAAAEVVTLVTLAAADDVAKELPQGRFKRVITFHDYPSAQPVVWVDAAADGIVISVRFPLIHEIARDAANKMMFYELFRRLF
jgi:hypothetical protein